MKLLPTFLSLFKFLTIAASILVLISFLYFFVYPRFDETPRINSDMAGLGQLALFASFLVTDIIFAVIYFILRYLRNKI